MGVGGSASTIESYKAIAVSVRTFESDFNSAEKDAKCEFKIDEKIRFKLAADGTGILKTEKNDTKRGLTGFRAPPGGPMAVINVVSLMFFQLVDSPDLKFAPRS